jgi:hypothetical protein
MPDARLGVRLQGARFSRFLGGRVSTGERAYRLTIALLGALKATPSVRRAVLVSFIPLLGFALWAFGRSAFGGLMGDFTADDHVVFAAQNLRSFLATQAACLVFLHTFAVAPAIVRDARTGALLLYFSRPIERVHYLMARVGAGLVLGLAVTVVPAIVLLIAQWAIMGAGANFGSDLRPSAAEVSASTLAPSASMATPVAFENAKPKPKLPMLKDGTEVRPPVLDAMPIVAAHALLVLVALLAGLAMSLACTLLALWAGSIAPTPGGASLAFGGSVAATWLVGAMAEAAFESETLLRAVSIHRMLTAPGELLLLPWKDRATSEPDRLMLLAALGLLCALAAAAWLILNERIRRPPRGEGRT